MSKRPTRRRALTLMATGVLGAGLALGSWSVAGAAEGGARPGLTDEQKACLEAQGITRPEKPADGSRPARPTEEQRAEHEAAAQACGVTLPARGHRHGPRGDRPRLTDEQKACLEAQGITKPEKPADGSRPEPPTAEQRERMRAAVDACGIPRLGGQGTSSGSGTSTT
jgi:hypothetical protein